MSRFASRIRMARLFNCGSCTIIGILFFLIFYFITRISEVFDERHPHTDSSTLLNVTNKEATWHSLNFANQTPSNLMIIFSAHEDQDHGSIRVLSLLSTRIRFKDSVWCVLKDESGKREYIVQPSIEMIPIHEKDGENAAYVPTMITCDLRDLQVTVGRTSIKIKHKDSSSEWISVTLPDTTSNDPVTCALPLEAEFDRSDLVLEFMAYHMVNGINKFSFFDGGVTEKVSDALISFQSATEVQVHKIGVPDFISEDKVSSPVYNAIATHFCLQSFVKHPIVVVTIKDLIAPRHYKLKAYISKKLSETDDVAALVIPMVLFCEENQENFKKVVDDDFRTKMINQNIRQISVFPHHIHSRVIVLRPNMVKFLGGHFTLEMSPEFDGKEEDTDSEEVLLFNYKPCTGIFTKKQIKEQNIIDNRLEIFRDEIVSILRARKT